MKEKLIEFAKKFLIYIELSVALIAGYFVGIYSYEITHPIPKKLNPYSQVYKPKDISVAVNESNDLLIVTKKTGDYVLYSDSIGNLIFKLYANRIFQANTSTITTKSEK